MALGRKTGGRVAGVPNKKTVLKVDEVLASLNIDPVSQLLKLVKDGKLADKDKARVWMELLSYCQAKPRELDVNLIDEDGEDLSSVPQEKLLTMIRNG